MDIIAYLLGAGFFGFVIGVFLQPRSARPPPPGKIRDAALNYARHYRKSAPYIITDHLNTFCRLLEDEYCRNLLTAIREELKKSGYSHLISPAPQNLEFEEEKLPLPPFDELLGVRFHIPASPDSEK